MKLLLDQGLPRSLSTLLKDEGYDAIHVGDIGLSKAADSVIMDHACLERRIIISLDADFHAHLALSGATQPSVIRIRIEGLKAQALLKLLCFCLGFAKPSASAQIATSSYFYAVKTKTSDKYFRTLPKAKGNAFLSCPNTVPPSFREK
jgi:predicted nuclease of predicted toxin-antitoxin system